MNPARIWTLGAVVAIVAIAAGAVGLGVQPQLASAAVADAATIQARSQSGATQVELARLSRLAATQSTLEVTNSKLGSAITGSLRLNTFSQQVRDTAALDGVALVSLSPAAAIAYVPAGAALTPAATTGSKAPAAAAVTPGQFGKTNPLITAADFTLIPVTVTVSGAEAAAVQFASDVQHMNRLFAVNTVGYTAGTADGAAPTTTISGNIYALKN
jgi:type II secretory pathway pseudopilin PulG